MNNEKEPARSPAEAIAFMGTSCTHLAPNFSNLEIFGAILYLGVEGIKIYSSREVSR
jgi:hypothetical protein